MSDNAQLARTGGALAVTIGGVGTVTGWWLLLVPAAVVAAGALLIRARFRRGRTAGER
ncbi:hypothetical protein [Streptomyces synnematoformans]|uniref:Uncharacterized protein n=1 Tax=Streptomyces synnematoformans TaxID=415721 RepID=A0ABP5IXQ8_9ACTN